MEVDLCFTRRSHKAIHRPRPSQAYFYDSFTKLLHIFYNFIDFFDLKSRVSIKTFGYLLIDLNSIDFSVNLECFYSMNGLVTTSREAEIDLHKCRSLFYFLSKYHFLALQLLWRKMKHSGILIISYWQRESRFKAKKTIFKFKTPKKK